MNVGETAMPLRNRGGEPGHGIGQREAARSVVTNSALSAKRSCRCGRRRKAADDDPDDKRSPPHNRR